MAVIRFTAVNRGQLPTWLPAAATFYIANSFQAFQTRIVGKREEAETLDGTPESYLHALQYEVSIATDFIPIYQRSLWRAFFTSIINRETFAIDFTARQLLGNDGWEAGVTTPWSLQSGASALSLVSSSALGSFAGRVTQAINANHQYVSQRVAALPGQSFLLQGLAARDGSSLPNRDAELYAVFRDSGAGFLAETNLGEALQSVSGYQRVSGVSAAAPANTTTVDFVWAKDTPYNTNEAGRWDFDEQTLAGPMSSWTNFSLVDDSIDEQQIGGVGVQYRFRVKTVP